VKNDDSDDVNYRGNKMTTDYWPRSMHESRVHLWCTRQPRRTNTYT